MSGRRLVGRGASSHVEGCQCLRCTGFPVGNAIGRGAFFDPAAISAAAVLPGELKPGDAYGWIAGLDPAFSSDPFGLVMVGRVPGDE